MQHVPSLDGTACYWYAVECETVCTASTQRVRCGVNYQHKTHQGEKATERGDFGEGGGEDMTRKGFREGLYEEPF